MLAGDDGLFRVTPSRRERLRWFYGFLWRESRRARRHLYRTARAPHFGPPQILLILGCQRSGTTLISNLFSEDRRAITFPEQGFPLSGGADLRLLPLDEVDQQVAGLRSQLIVLKPIVESQRAPELLARLQRSRILWMFRDYRDVAASSLRAFGVDNGIRDLELLLTNDPPNWRGELVPDDTRSALDRFVGPHMSPYDAAALFWWARNMLFFQLDLAGRPDVRLCSYDMLINEPVNVLRDVYEFLGISFPGERLGRSVSTRALGRGGGLNLSPPVEDLCRRLYERLNDELAGQ